MVGRHKAPAAQDGTQQQQPAGRDWKRRAILIGLTVVAVIIGYVILTAFIPRWWAQRMGKAVGGSFTMGTVFGLCLGILFTLLPLAVLYFALRSRRSWKVKGVWALVAVILAAPNLATLAVAIGTGSAAHAGQRTMDVDAPAFRGATLAGVIIAVVAFIFLMILIQRGRRPKAPKQPKTPTPAPTG